jgi:hypothetical protein
MWCRIRGKDPDPIVKIRVNYRAVGDWGTASLLMSGANQVVRLGSAGGPLTAPLTGFGSLGLGIYSVRSLVKADSGEQRLDATHGIAWSLQGMAGLGKALQSRAAWIGPTATTMGVAGGLLQTGAGAYKAATGVKARKRSRAILGCLDMGAGICWAASACSIANPYTLGGFVVLATVRLAYARRDNLKRLACRIRDGFRRQQPGVQQEEQPTVIVTAPERREVVERAARGPGTIQVNDTSGRAAAVITPATARTSSGKERPAIVVTPIEQEPAAP